MTNNLPPKVVTRRGMTLLEVTIIIVVFLSLISILIVGARAWKRGSDRAACVINIRNVQVAARSYQNLYGYYCGGRPYAENGSQDIAEHLFAKGYIAQKSYEQASGIQECPSGGNYHRDSPDMFPKGGELYITCSLSESDAHEPNTNADW